MRKAAALIRQAFHIDPYALSEEEFAARLAEAIWLKKTDQERLEAAFEKSLVKLFGGRRR